MLFFIHLSSRKVHVAGITATPDENWMKQVARNVTMFDVGFLQGCRYLIHDRDSKFCKSFRRMIQSGGVKPLKLPPKSPNLNAFSERFVRSIKSECLSNFIFFGEESLRKAIHEYVQHYHEERNHQGKNNLLLFPGKNYDPENTTGRILRKLRLNGLLNYYYREAA